MELKQFFFFETLLSFEEEMEKEFFIRLAFQHLRLWFASPKWEEALVTEPSLPTENTIPAFLSEPLPAFNGLSHFFSSILRSDPQGFVFLGCRIVNLKEQSLFDTIVVKWTFYLFLSRKNFTAWDRTIYSLLFFFKIVAVVQRQKAEITECGLPSWYSPGMLTNINGFHKWLIIECVFFYWTRVRKSYWVNSELWLSSSSLPDFFWEICNFCFLWRSVISMDLS